MQVLNVSTGTTVTTPIPGGQPSGFYGFFTDDGRLLAVMLPSGAIGVYDTQSQKLTVIPGTILANDVAMTFGWLDGSHRLVIEAAPGNSNSDRAQIAYWQPGDTRLRVATISIPGGEAMVFDGPNQPHHMSHEERARYRNSSLRSGSPIGSEPGNRPATALLIADHLAVR